jgi:hypothetical protein
MLIMTLDDITRRQAEEKHQQLKNSLFEANAAFIQRFQADADFFRSIPPTNFGALTQDLVRAEQISQCCKRVRIWRKQLFNPLLAYKSQSQGKGSKKNDRRIHISILMSMIIDIYEQRLAIELDETRSQNAEETFSDFVIKFVSSKLPNRRSAIDQLYAVVSTLQLAPTHPRVRVFMSLCGLDEMYNPPEKIHAFLQILNRLHRCKVFLAHVNSTTIPGAAIRTEEISSMTSMIFHNIGIPQNGVKMLIQDLFDHDYYWNFRFWESHCEELGIAWKWPADAPQDVFDNALKSGQASRTVALNNASTRKIDGDQLLDLLVKTWCNRASELYHLLEQATEAEEERNLKTLDRTRAIQESQQQISPLTEPERAIFRQLFSEYCDSSEIPWTHPKVLKKLASIQNTRKIPELQQVYETYRIEMEQGENQWKWHTWRWESEWEWGTIIVKKPKVKIQSLTQVQEETHSTTSSQS